MKERIVNIVTGSSAALDEHATAIRSVQQRIDDLTEVGRLFHQASVR